jgi:hypothetical protein
MVLSFYVYEPPSFYDAISLAVIASLTSSLIVSLNHPHLIPLPKFEEVEVEAS